MHHIFCIHSSVEGHLSSFQFLAEHEVPNRGVRERTEGVEGVYNLIVRTTISTNQTPPQLPETKSSTKEYIWLQLHM